MNVFSDKWNKPSYLSAKINQYSNVTELKSLLCVEELFWEVEEYSLKRFHMWTFQISTVNVSMTVEAKPILKRIAAEVNGHPPTLNSEVLENKNGFYQCFQW